jgi:hypothetical protein
MLDIITGREYEKNGEKKMVWRTIGTAFEKDGGRFALVFDALPLPGRLCMIVPRKQQQPEQQNYDQSQGW